MVDYSLATFETGDRAKAGLVIGNRIHDLAIISGNPDYATILGVLADWDTAKPLLAKIADQGVEGRRGLSIDKVALLPPILYPPAVYCAGANYLDHLENMARAFGAEPPASPRDNGGKPFHFLKASYCCVGPDAHVKLPSERLDWEGELVAVIGRKARNVAIEDALDYVAGYMVGNDLSARDLHFRANLPDTNAFRHSWLDHKSFEHSAPVGPWIVPADQVGNAADLTLRTWVNGDLKQDGTTSAMVFNLAEQISYLSSRNALQPGDIIMTGTPGGVGAETNEFLKVGDVVTVEIERLGALTTYIV